MIYNSDKMQEQAVLQTAARMCAAARTAPKAKGVDTIRALVLTGADKDALAERMEQIGVRDFGEKAGAWYGRDAGNVRAAQAVVLIGAKPSYRGVRCCGFCGFENCAACKAAGGSCAMTYVDLGIALSSAARIASEDCVDSRIMFSAGKAAMELGYEADVLWQGIPISVSGKSIFFDR